MTRKEPRTVSYSAVVVSVVDGDTLHVALTDELLSGLLPAQTEITIRPKLRLAGINCPELSTDKGLQARDFTVQWLLDHPGPYTVSVRGIGQDKYANRIDGTLRAADGHCLNDDLLAAGQAVVMKS